MPVNKKVFKSKDLVADCLAELIYGSYIQYLKQRPSVTDESKMDAKYDFFNIAVSGGSIPELMWQGLKRLNDSKANDKKIDFKDWNVFMADERVVNLDHEDSNYRLFMQARKDYYPEAQFRDKAILHLDTDLVVKAEACMKGESSDTQKLEETVADIAENYYSRIIQAYKPTKAIKKVMLHMILLGCGPDGHTCSLFPDLPPIDAEESIGYVLNSPKPPPVRITMTMQLITNARNAVFVVTGESKKKILQRIFDNTDGENKLPTQIVNQTFATKSCQCTWLMDEDAYTEQEDDAVFYN